MKCPTAWTDVTDTPHFLRRIAPAISQAYYNAYQPVYAQRHNCTTPALFPHVTRTPKCLYMIVSLGFVDELGGRDLFNESSIGDTDGDGFPEFLDAWGTPIDSCAGRRGSPRRN